MHGHFLVVSNCTRWPRSAQHDRAATIDCMSSLMHAFDGLEVTVFVQTASSGSMLCPWRLIRSVSI